MLCDSSCLSCEWHRAVISEDSRVRVHGYNHIATLCIFVVYACAVMRENTREPIIAARSTSSLGSENGLGYHSGVIQGLRYCAILNR